MSQVVPDIFDTNVKKSKLAKCIRLVERKTFKTPESIVQTYLMFRLAWHVYSI